MYLWARAMATKRREADVTIIKIFARPWDADSLVPHDKCRTVQTIEHPEHDVAVEKARFECLRRTAGLSEKKRAQGWAYEWTYIRKGA